MESDVSSASRSRRRAAMFTRHIDSSSVRNRWKRAEVFAFIDAIHRWNNEHKIQPTQKEFQQWKELAESVGWPENERTGEDCKTKLKYLQQQYNSVSKMSKDLRDTVTTSRIFAHDSGASADKVAPIDIDGAIEQPVTSTRAQPKSPIESITLPERPRPPYRRPADEADIPLPKRHLSIPEAQLYDQFTILGTKYHMATSELESHEVIIAEARSNITSLQTNLLALQRNLATIHQERRALEKQEQAILRQIEKLTVQSQGEAP